MTRRWEIGKSFKMVTYKSAPNFQHGSFLSTFLMPFMWCNSVWAVINTVCKQIVPGPVSFNYMIREFDVLIQKVHWTNQTTKPGPWEHIKKYSFFDKHIQFFKHMAQVHFTYKQYLAWRKQGFLLLSIHKDFCLRYQLQESWKTLLCLKILNTCILSHCG